MDLSRIFGAKTFFADVADEALVLKVLGIDVPQDLRLGHALVLAHLAQIPVAGDHQNEPVRVICN